jgi:hypothetical protein
MRGRVLSSDRSAMVCVVDTYGLAV